MWAHRAGHRQSRGQRHVFPEAGPSSFALSERDGEIRVQVSDQGPGIPSEDREAIFRKFHTARPRARAASPAAQARACHLRPVVRAHGGRIWVEDNAGGGSVFTFSLPTRAQVNRTESGPPSSLIRHKEQKGLCFQELKTCPKRGKMNFSGEHIKIF